MSDGRSQLEGSALTGSARETVAMRACVEDLVALRPPEAHQAAYATADDYEAMVAYANVLEDALRDRESLTPARVFRQLADLLATTEDISYDALAAGPLGEALTRVELREIADDHAAIAGLVVGLLQSAAAATPGTEGPLSEAPKSREASEG